MYREGFAKPLDTQTSLNATYELNRHRNVIKDKSKTQRTSQNPSEAHPLNLYRVCHQIGHRFEGDP